MSQSASRFVSGLLGGLALAAFLVSGALAQESAPPEEMVPKEEGQPAPDGEGQPATAGEEEPANGEEGAPPEKEGPAPVVALKSYPEASERHELKLGEGGSAELFLCDRARVRVAGEDGSAALGYYTGFPEAKGYALALGGGRMELHLGVNPVTLSLPVGEVVLEGMGTAVTIAPGKGEVVFSRTAGESGDLTVFASGKAEVVPPGSELRLGPEGLPGEAGEKAPSALREAPDLAETFHYLTGKKGSGEIALPGESLLNLGNASDLMITANRAPVIPRFLAEFREGAFYAKSMEATGLLLETSRNRISFAPPEAAEEAPAGEETGAGDEDGEAVEGGEGDDGLEAGEEDAGAEAGPDGNVVWINIRGVKESFRHSAGGKVVLASKHLAGFKMEIPSGGGAHLLHPEGQARVIVDVFESEEGAVPIKIVIGDRVFILPPSAKAELKPGGEGHPEEGGEVVLDKGSFSVMIYGVGEPLSYRFRISERDIVKPLGTAFANAGDIRKAEEASPFLPK